MLRIYIVDDEEIACRGLAHMVRRIFDRSQQEIHCFTSPIAALDKMKEYKPDIILLDITMEEMNGLEFISKIDPGIDPKIVIISGNDAYSFVRECFKMNVEDYLLKPIEYDELKTLMLRLYDIKHSEQREPDASEYGWGFAVIVKTESEDPMLRQIIEIPQKYDLWDQVSVLTYNEPCRNSIFIFSLRRQEHYQTCQTALHEILFAAARENGRVYKGAYSSLVQTEQINAAITEVKELFKNRIYDADTNCYGPEHPLQQTGRPDSEYEKDLIGLTPFLSNKDVEAYQRFIRKWFDPEGLQDLDYDTVKNRYEGFKNKLIREIRPENNRFGTKGFDEFNTLSEMSDEIALMLREISDFLNRNYAEAGLLSEVLNFIHENYNKDIDLSYISNQFNLSYSYFSRIFKMYAGISFTQYLLKVRMEKAKELLVFSPELKIKEVALRVGYDYDNVQNFTRAFKNYFGRSPQHYKSNKTSNTKSPD